MAVASQIKPVIYIIFFVDENAPKAHTLRLTPLLLVLWLWLRQIGQQLSVLVLNWEPEIIFFFPSSAL